MATSAMDVESLPYITASTLSDGEQIEVIGYRLMHFGFSESYRGLILDPAAVDFFSFAARDCPVLLAHRGGKHLFEKPDNIYFILDVAQRLIKIGRSVSPKARLKTIRRTVGRAKIVGLIPIPIQFAELVDFEASLHWKFRESQAIHPLTPLSKEWFYPSRDLIAYITDRGGAS